MVFWPGSALPRFRIPPMVEPEISLNRMPPWIRASETDAGGRNVRGAELHAYLPSLTKGVPTGRSRQAFSVSSAQE